MAFNKQAITLLMQAVQSLAQQTGLFERSMRHEPKSAPGNRLSLVLYMAGLEPLPRASGLASTTGKVTLMARIYSPFTAKPEDDIDPAVTNAAGELIGALTADLTLGGTVRNVDILGQFGAAVSAQAGYIEQDGTHYRVMEVTIPIVINDLWTQAD